MQNIINFFGPNTNVLEIGSGVGMHAAMLAQFGDIHMTCTEIKPPDSIYHECYIIDDPFENHKNCQKKKIDGTIELVDYDVPNFDALFISWAPSDFHIEKDQWYKLDEVLTKALTKNSKLKVALIGENDFVGSCGTTKSWKILNESFVFKDLIFNPYNSATIHECIILYSVK